MEVKKKEAEKEKNTRTVLPKQAYPEKTEIISNTVGGIGKSRASIRDHGLFFGALAPCKIMFFGGVALDIWRPKGTGLPGEDSDVVD